MAGGLDKVFVLWFLFAAAGWGAPHLQDRRLYLPGLHVLGPGVLSRLRCGHPGSSPVCRAPVSDCSAADGVSLRSSATPPTTGLAGTGTG